MTQDDNPNIRRIRTKHSPYPLVTLVLDCHEPSFHQDRSFDCDWIWNAVADGIFPNLRKVGLHRDLDGEFMTGRKLGEGAAELNELLKALAREDGDGAVISEDDAGVYII